MNFYWVYLIIPLILYFFKPIKNNKLLILYWAFIVIFSYDNVTDFLFYYEEFFFYKDGIEGEFTERGREPLWIALNKLFMFSDYGVVIIHLLVQLIVVRAFSLYSNRYKILNASILLYFLLNLTWKFDNILRQDLAIVTGMIAFFEVLKNDDWNKKRVLKVSALTLISIEFHYASFVLVPLYFFVRWISKVKFKIWLVVVMIVLFILIAKLQIIQDSLILFTIVFSVIGGDYGSYYVDIFNILNFGSGGILSVILSLVSVSPLLYFICFRRKIYENDLILRTCVNLSWIYIVWKVNFNVDLLTRPVEFISWFALWGFGFMIQDFMVTSVRRFHVIPFILFLSFIVCNSYSLSSFIGNYYGDNHYMTVFSKDCQSLNIYERDLTAEGSYKRIRK
jgi:hypothetical protein